MKNALIAALGAALSLSLCACHPPRATPISPEQSAQSAAPDSAPTGGLARRDSTRDKARADVLSEAERQRMHADSVRAQVKGEMGMEGAGITSWGLPPHDSTMLADRIHFDYDRADLSPEDLAQLEAKRQVLVAHPNLVIQIVGNADERGPDEYNLALGERRAAAGKRWLLAAGIADSRISIVSWGEEHPLDPGHDESSWAKNRRDEFMVVRAAQQR